MAHAVEVFDPGARGDPKEPPVADAHAAEPAASDLTLDGGGGDPGDFGQLIGTEEVFM